MIWRRYRLQSKTEKHPNSNESMILSKSVRYFVMHTTSIKITARVQRTEIITWCSDQEEHLG